MAIYHCDIRNIGRGNGSTVSGKSSVAAAAYRAGESLYDERTGDTWNYSNRTSDIMHTGIYAANDAPEWVFDRGQLWNMAEASEKRKDARTAKEVIMALPVELDDAHKIQVVENFVAANITKHGVVADVAIHDYGRAHHPDDKNDKKALIAQQEIAKWQDKNLPFLALDEAAKARENGQRHVKMEIDRQGAITGYKLYQPHAHIMSTTRALEGDKFSMKKCAYMQRKALIYDCRFGVQNQLNQTFKALGLEVRVSAAKKNEQASNDDAYFDGKKDPNNVASFAFQLQEFDLKYRQSWRDMQAQQKQAIQEIQHTEDKRQQAQETTQQGGVTSTGIAEAMHQFMRDGQTMNQLNLQSQYPALSTDEALSLQFMQWGKDFDRRSRENEIHSQQRRGELSGYAQKTEWERER